jgi:hypothetical protein
MRLRVALVATALILTGVTMAAARPPVRSPSNLSAVTSVPG